MSAEVTKPVEAPVAQPSGLEKLLKVFADDDEHKAELAKTLGGITEAVTKLSERIEEIAKQLGER